MFLATFNVMRRSGLQAFDFFGWRQILTLHIKSQSYCYRAVILVSMKMVHSCKLFVLSQTAEQMGFASLN